MTYYEQNARPILESVARVLAKNQLEAILIGNAPAALQGAPVTTIDFDFLFRRTPRNIQKLKAVAKELGAVILRPFYPAFDLFRVVRDDDGLQLDFMTTIHGVDSFAALRAQSRAVDLAGHSLLVASLSSVLASKRAAGRPRDKAVLDILKATLREEEARQPKAKTRRPQGGE